jgi:hypothetical protein
MFIFFLSVVAIYHHLGVGTEEGGLAEWGSGSLGSVGAEGVGGWESGGCGSAFWGSGGLGEWGAEEVGGWESGGLWEWLLGDWGG